MDSLLYTSLYTLLKTHYTNDILSLLRIQKYPGNLLQFTIAVRIARVRLPKIGIKYKCQNIVKDIDPVETIKNLMLYSNIRLYDDLEFWLCETTIVHVINFGEFNDVETLLHEAIRKKYWLPSNILLVLYLKYKDRILDLYNLLFVLPKPDYCEIIYILKTTNQSNICSWMLLLPFTRTAEVLIAVKRCLPSLICNMPIQVLNWCGKTQGILFEKIPLNDLIKILFNLYIYKKSFHVLIKRLIGTIYSDYLIHVIVERPGWFIYALKVIPVKFFDYIIWKCSTYLSHESVGIILDRTLRKNRLGMINKLICFSCDHLISIDHILSISPFDVPKIITCNGFSSDMQIRLVQHCNFFVAHFIWITNSLTPREIKKIEDSRKYMDERNKRIWFYKTNGL